MAKPSIQDIFIEKRKKRPSASAASHGGGKHRLPPRPRHPSLAERFDKERENRPRRRYVLYALAGVAFVFFLFSLSIFFVGATVTVYPKEREITVARTVTASKSGATPLHFETLELSDTASMKAAATGTKEVRKKASGTIIVYNAYDGNAQRLIKNTRFETPDGKIFRIDAPIVVPGMTTVSGKSVPGSVEAIVYADEPGPEYNIGKTDFTLPGFKGSPRYDKFYARSKTVMQGGQIGTTFAVSEKDEADATAALTARLKDSLEKKAKENVPADFVLYQDAMFFDYDDIKVTGAEGAREVTIEEKGTLRALIMNRASVAKYLAQAEIRDFNGLPVESPTLDRLNFVLKDKAKLDPTELGAVSFGLSGTTTIVWSYDEKALKSDLLGKPKKNFQSILGKYKAIDKAALTISPFWAQTLPDSEDDIQIVRERP
ncbi:hypothetical protein KW797_01455 [Candidatus Parcubacteria bacterium]|nr:hypothetical protein [Candidatus Parcubacteria bacterium]